LSAKQNIINKHEVFHWVNLMEKLYDLETKDWVIGHIENELELRSFIVGQELTFADICVFAALKCLKGFTGGLSKRKFFKIFSKKRKIILMSHFRHTKRNKG